MKITISIDQVLRDVISQFDYVYKKYKHDDKEKFDANQITDYNLLSHYDFKDRLDLNTFMHEEASLEIFGHADLMYDNLNHKLNTFLVEIYDEEEHEVELVSKNFYKSKPASLFFLAKVNCMVDNIRFVNKDEDEWGKDTDVLITANPISLSNKPHNKTSVKIIAPYNKDVVSDFEYNSILDVFNNLKQITK